MATKDKTKVVSVRINVDDEGILRDMAEFKGVSFTELMRTMIENQIEEEIDKELYKRAIEVESNENDESISWEEALEQLGVADEI